MLAFKIALRDLIRHKNRTIFTILCVFIGTILIGSVVIASDSIRTTLKDNFDERLGAANIFLKPSTEEIGETFPFNQSYIDLLDDMEEVRTYVPRLMNKSYVTFNSSSIFTDLSLDIVGIDADLPQEKNFGQSSVVDTISGYEHLTFLEDLLLIPGNSCVLAERTALSYNLSVGNTIHILAENLTLLGQNETQPDTWTKFTIVGIVSDFGEAVSFEITDLENPDLRFIPFCIFVRMDLSYDYVYNNKKSGNEINYLMIQAEEFAKIDETANLLERSFEEARFHDNSNWYAVNILKDYARAATDTLDAFILIFNVLGILALLLCATIIKNILETSLDTTSYEVGIYRAIGTDKGFLYRIFLYQLLIMGLIGTIIGILTSIGASFFILDTLSNLDLLYNSYYWSTLNVDFHVSVSVKSVGITSLCGLGMPLVFGIFPIWKLCSSDVLKALHPEKIKETSNHNPFKNLKDKNTLRIFAAKMLASLSLGISGFFLTRYGLNGFFNNTLTLQLAGYFYIVILLLGLITLIVSVLFFGGIIYPYTSYILSYVIYPLFRELRLLGVRNTTRKRKQTRNLFTILAIGMIVLTFSTTISASFIKGGYKSGQIRWGGDIQTEVLAPYNITTQLRYIDQIETVCPYRWDREGMLIDDFGNKSIVGEEENFKLYSLGANEYWKIVQKIAEDTPSLKQQFNGWDALFETFENGGYIILDPELEAQLGKGVGDTVEITWDFGSKRTFTILEYLQGLPGFPEALRPDEASYDTYGIIIWDDYEEVAYDYLGEDLFTSKKWGAFANILLKSPDFMDDTIEVIKSLAKSYGFIITDLDFATAKEYERDGATFLKIVMVVISFVLTISLIGAILGILFVMISSIRHRSREIGMMRSTGTSPNQVLRLVFGETFIIGFVGVFIGLLGGILVTIAVLQNFPFNPLLNFVLIFPTGTIFGISGIILGVLLLSGVIPAIHASQIDIVDAIRKRD